MRSHFYEISHLILTDVPRNTNMLKLMDIEYCSNIQLTVQEEMNNNLPLLHTIKQKSRGVTKFSAYHRVTIRGMH